MELTNATGTLLIKQLGSVYELTAEPVDRKTAGRLRITTDYPIPLIREIFKESGAGWTCDEISRDVDMTDSQLDVRLSVEAYFPDEVFDRPMRILDYGCGRGSSTLALARLFPNAEIVATDFVPAYLDVAKLRFEHYGKSIHVYQTQPTGDVEGKYDFVFLNAVYEHLLPDERGPVMRKVLSALNPGGTLIINQTPHRGFPIDAHTTNIPLINYLPRSIAHRLANAKSGHDNSWDHLLRIGIRGATVHEIMRHVGDIDSHAKLRKPIRVAKSWAEIWYVAKCARVGSRLTRLALSSMGKVVGRLRLPFAPYLNIAVTRSLQ